MPDPATIEKVIQKISAGGANYAYFFGTLKSVVWVRPLLERGYFSEPPTTQRDEDWFYDPIWPESRYLARVAEQDPDAVLEALQNIPETSNQNVQYDILEAAIALPPRAARQLIPRIRRSLRKRFSFITAQRVARFCQNLTEADEGDSALALADILFDVVPDPDQEEAEDGSRFWLRRARPLYDFHMFENLAYKLSPTLTRTLGMQWIVLLAAKLARALELEFDPESEREHDTSYIWHLSVDGPQGHAHDAKTVLVIVLRDSCANLIESDAENFLEARECLRQHRWLIFRRIDLYLLRRFSACAPDEVAATIVNREVFDNHSMTQEYQRLVAACFKSIPDNLQERYLQWVDEPPDYASERASKEKVWGKVLSNSEIDESHHYLQLKRLYGLRDVLPKPWRERYDQWTKNYGPPTLDTHRYDTGGGGRWGNVSPKTKDELLDMSVDELHECLRTWKPTSSDMDEPTEEGLADVLVTVVEEAPDRFSEQAAVFGDLGHAFTFAFLDGISKGMSAQRSVAWRPLIVLFRAIVERATDVDNRRWVWCRQKIASLLSDGLESKESAIPLSLDTEVFTILKLLCRDTDPTPEREEEESNLDPFTFSLNCVRGVAAHAVVRYTLWKRRELEQTGKSDLDPETVQNIKSVFDPLLDPDIESSLAVRTVFGQWFPWLVLFSEEWAGANVDRIFPKEAQHAEVRRAVWETYVSYCRAYTDMFALLKDHYSWAAKELLLTSGKAESHGPDRNQALAEHLMVYFGRGVLPLDDELMVWFWKNGDSAVREHAVKFIGRSVSDPNGKAPEDVLRRFETLCDARIAVAKKEDVGTREELLAFGWWFASDAFDDEWILDHLYSVLELTDGEVDIASPVLERLLKVDTALTDKVARNLDKLVRGDRKGWSISSWKQPLRDLLTRGLESDEVKAREISADLLYYLGTSGFHEFRDLAKLTP